MLLNQEFIDEFIEEAKEHLTQIENNIVHLSNDPEGDAIHSLFRAVHSIKGSAGFFGLKNIVRLTHTLESVFGFARNGKFLILKSHIDIFLEAFDCLSKMIENVLDSEYRFDDYIIDTLENLVKHIPETPVILTRSVVFDMDETNAVLRENRDFEVDNANESPIWSEVVNREQSKYDNLLHDYLRVNVKVLNELLHLASEMVLARNQLLTVMSEHKKEIAGIVPILQNVDRLTSSLQEKIMQTRLQPLSHVFGKFPRMIRELSKTLDKELHLIIEGEEVELDKSVIEGLSDPITHLIRNSADHGIESSYERERAGKPRNGTIRLKAVHEGGRVYVDVSDDGAGIDIAKVKSKAIENKLITTEEAQTLSEQEILHLIFLPGFSTKHEVTEISGRGVGMDVVKTNIAKLGGNIEVSTTAGQGTRMRLSLPLTLAIMQSLVIEAQGHRFAIPQSSVWEIMKIKSGDTQKNIKYIHRSPVLHLRDRLVPLLHLSSILDMQNTKESIENHSVKGTSKQKYIKEWNAKIETEERYSSFQPQSMKPSDMRVVILQIESKTFGLIVDRILGNEETLIKSLPVFLKHCLCYAGVTIMGDGKACMILNPEGLIHVSGLKLREDDTGIRAKQEVSMISASESIQNLLLFSCSGDSHVALDMNMVSRIEEIESHAIQKIEQKEFVEFRGNVMRIIRLQEFLSFTAKKNAEDKYFIIVLKVFEKSFGIIVESILDNITGHFPIHTQQMRKKGIEGSILWQGKLVIVLQPFEILEMLEEREMHT